MLALLLAFLPTEPLPADWHGTWSGKLVMTGPADKVTEVPLSLKIEPIGDGPELTWTLTYGDGPKATVKDYKLVPVADRPGRFRIDERNGSVLDARLVGGVLYGHFETGGQVLTARYELRDGVVRFEVTSARPTEKTAGGKVQNYAVDAVQTGELRKK